MAGANSAGTSGKPQSSWPLATYRLQFTRQFQFDDASALLSYLAELGISDVYASPVLRAGPESTHGYDVCSLDEIDPKLGGQPAFTQLLSGLKSHGLGLLLDFVPNHMRADTVNNLWRSVLEQGRDSPCASFFDIDWDAQDSRVLLPILEDQYGRVLEAGKITLVFENGEFWFSYYDNRLPASLETYQLLAKELLPVLPSYGPEAHWLRRQVDAPPTLEQIKTQWRELTASCPAFSRTLEQHLKVLNGTPGEPRSFDALDDIVQLQHYRLCWWRIAPEEINYRRFFDINDLVCLNAHHPEVFEASHRLVLQLIDSGVALGLRIDHPDGLWDPQEYFARLQTLHPGMYVVAEKILSQEEHLPSDWPVAGTTGYEFLNQLNGIFIKRSSEARLTQIYNDFATSTVSYDSLLFNLRRKVLYQSFYRQLQSLVRHLKRIAAQHRSGRDFTLRAIETALANFIAAFPNYRTYISPRTQCLSTQEQQAIAAAARQCLAHAPETDPAIVDFIQRLLQSPSSLDENARNSAMKLQQLTAPLAAKGLEDTLCYVYNRFISLNEVGGDPWQLGKTVESFHQSNEHRAQSWPHTLLTTSTHDTKRGEDVRARLNCLSEIADEWEAAVRRWSERLRGAKTQSGGALLPSRNDEYLFYQTLIGAWPADGEHLDQFQSRITDYMLKAIREAKEQTSWTQPSEGYENAVNHFVEQAFASNDFLNDVKQFQKRVQFFGCINSLSQVVLKIASPGVPDFYQGTEFWDLTLVDPDNRRPVDFEKRRQCLAYLKSQLATGTKAEIASRLLDSPWDPTIKLYTTWQALQLRRAQAEVFTHGEYVPLTVSGTKREHVCAFLRRKGAREIITAAPRLVYGLTDGRDRAPIGGEIWQDTFVALPQSNSGFRFEDAFTGRKVATAQTKEGIGIWAAELFAEFPVALLANVTAPTSAPRS